MKLLGRLIGMVLARFSGLALFAAALVPSYQVVAPVFLYLIHTDAEVPLVMVG